MWIIVLLLSSGCASRRSHFVVLSRLLQSMLYLCDSRIDKRILLLRALTWARRQPQIRRNNIYCTIDFRYQLISLFRYWKSSCRRSSYRSLFRIKNLRRRKHIPPPEIMEPSGNECLLLYLLAADLTVVGEDMYFEPPSFPPVNRLDAAADRHRHGLYASLSLVSCH